MTSGPRFFVALPAGPSAAQRAEPHASTKQAAHTIGHERDGADERGETRHEAHVEVLHVPHSRAQSPPAARRGCT